jgi:hypothetical protein
MPLQETTLQNNQDNEAENKVSMRNRACNVNAKSALLAQTYPNNLESGIDVYYVSSNASPEIAR